MPHTPRAELDAGLDHIRRAPKETGLVRLIVRRPGEDRREVLTEAKLDPRYGLVGDDWQNRHSRSTPDGSPDPAMQVTVMGARVAALIADDEAGWALAGDQLYVDLDISLENLPPGTRLTVGEATIEVSAQPHTGCAKFRKRFGADALRWANSPTGRDLRLRGLNARVVGAGIVRTGDSITKR
jgi:hypothetical protein